MSGKPRALASLPVRLLVPCAACVFAAVISTAHAASPSLSNVLPRGGQRGTELPVSLSGARLADAQEVLFYSPGFTVKKLEAADKEVKVSLSIAPDCELGEHALRVRTSSGVTELRTFWVGALPPVDETEPNSDFAVPQKITLDTTVDGVVGREDVDYFAFEARKGQRVSAEIEGMRLGNAIFDPYVAILNSARFELAASDDSPLLGQDGVAQAIVPEDGTYVVEVRESAYGGADNCWYRLHVGTFPRPLAVYPAGGKVGEETEVEFLGDLGPPMKHKLKLPETGTPGFGLFAENEAGVAPSANTFRISAYGNVLEIEPNKTHQEATPGAWPVAFNGILSEPGDVDCFRFPAKKGEVLEVGLYGRRLRSPIDSVLRIHHLGGGQVAANDDSGGPDSYLRFTAPEDKEYVISVTDHLGKGGPTYVYRVEVEPVKPRLSVSLPKVRQYSQDRQVIAVPRGNRYATLVAASRADFGGDLILSAEGLPAGLELSCESMPANLTVTPVVFEAKPDAPLAGAVCLINARHADPSKGIGGGFHQVVELSVGNPGQSVYWQHQVERLAVAVTDEAPFEIRIVEPKVPLVENGSLRLKVVAERKEGFTAPIGIAMIFNPPGVNAAGGVKIPEGANEASILLNANSGAQVGSWKIVVSGVATVGNGPVWVATPFAKLEVAPPFLTISMTRAAAEQGQPTQVFCKVDKARALPGPAKVALVGLPHKVSAPAVEVSGETKEFAFEVAVDKESPPGNHKNIFCQVELTQEGESIVHATGSTELRIDKPLTPKPNEPPKEKPPPKPKAEEKPAPKAPAKPKPLTRLEKLRLEKQKRLEGTKNSEAEK